MGTLNAQKMTRQAAPKQSAILKPAAPQQISTQQQPTAPKVSTTPVASTPPIIYYLFGAKLLIKNGSDSKELPSTVYFSLFRSSKSDYSGYSNDNKTLLFEYLPNTTNKREFAANTTTPITLTPIYSMAYRYDEIDFSKIEKSGLKLNITYHPNFFMDAWKIDKVTLVLEIKDAKGNPHPALNNKEIPFITANKLLTHDKNTLVMETDGFLMPKN